MRMKIKAVLFSALFLLTGLAIPVQAQGGPAATVEQRQMANDEMRVNNSPAVRDYIRVDFRRRVNARFLERRIERMGFRVAGIRGNTIITAPQRVLVDVYGNDRWDRDDRWRDRRDRDDRWRDRRDRRRDRRDDRRDRYRDREEILVQFAVNIQDRNTAVVYGNWYSGESSGAEFSIGPFNVQLGSGSGWDDIERQRINSRSDREDRLEHAAYLAMERFARNLPRF